MATSGNIPASGVSGAGQFATTLWSVVLRAGAPSSPAAGEALEKLCRAYWTPIYAYLRRLGRSEHDAQDLAQAFFAHLLEKESLQRADPNKGRFRSFLLGALNRFIADEADKARAQKRGGDRSFISLDAETPEKRVAMEPVDPIDPEKLYERRWAVALLDRVFAELKSAYAADGKEEIFSKLHVYLREGKEGGKYAEAAADLGMAEGAVKVEVFRMRRAFRHFFRQEIAQTVENTAEIEDEIRHLARVLRS